MDYKRLKVAEDGDLTIITLSDPATLNAASMEMAQELHHAFAVVGAPGSATRAVVLTGEGRGFCSGANLSAGPGPWRRRIRPRRKAGRGQGAGAHIQPPDDGAA